MPRITDARCVLAVHDLARSTRFYTETLGFAKKDDVTNGPYRWLTVTAPSDPSGVALQLALDAPPAAKAYQEAMFQQQQPAAMFMTDDLARDYERMKAAGAKFTGPPTEVMPGVSIATLDDGVGNLVQITQLDQD